MFSLASLLPPKNLFILQNIPFSFPSHVVTVRTTTFSPGHWPLVDLAVDIWSKVGQGALFLRNLKSGLRNCIFSLVVLLNWVATRSSYFLPSGLRREYGDRKQWRVGTKDKRRKNTLVSIQCLVLRSQSSSKAQQHYCPREPHLFPVP